MTFSGVYTRSKDKYTASCDDSNGEAYDGTTRRYHTPPGNRARQPGERIGTAAKGNVHGPPAHEADGQMQTDHVRSKGMVARRHAPRRPPAPPPAHASILPPFICLPMPMTDPAMNDPAVTKPDAPSAAPINLDIAEQFREAADLLEAQDASPFRVRAYRQGASTLTSLDRSVEDLYAAEGREGLVDLPSIGASLANAIVEVLETGRWRYGERLRGTVTPELVFRQLPGIGPTLAERIHDALGVETLEALEQAAHDGRLADVEGIGARRLQGLRDALAARLRRRASGTASVPVSELLDVDREYRHKAAAGTLRTIAPRRFNPANDAWLPILHTERDDRHYTALYSNTARAHALDRTNDWVVIYREDTDQAQWTVVTETSGSLEGKRVVRGREAACLRHYQDQSEASTGQE